jgi:glycosyltransferase involved in cell wall biosynthesis
LARAGLPEDSEALADAIGFLIEHPEERARLGAAGRRIAEAELGSAA